MVLADTNVVFSFLVDNDWSEAAGALQRRDPEWRTESHALVELTNVFARYVRARLMTEEETFLTLARAEMLFRDGVLRVRHRDALRMALDRQISAYDARFLVAAQELGVKLVTEDAKLRRAAPDLTQSLEGPCRLTRSANKAQTSLRFLPTPRSAIESSGKYPPTLMNEYLRLQDAVGPLACSPS